MRPSSYTCVAQCKSEALVFSQKQYSRVCMMMCLGYQMSPSVPSSVGLVQTLVWLALAQVSLPCATFYKKDVP